MSVIQMQEQHEKDLQQQIVTPDLKKILRTIIGQKATIQCISIVKLYTASQNSVFRFSNLTGLLCLVWDRERQAPFFRMFSPDNLELIFECELYIDFHKFYKKFDHKFYVFEFIKGFIGFSFAFEEEAEEMFQQIQNNSPKKEQISEENNNNINSKDDQKERKELFGFRRGLKKLFHKSARVDKVNSENNMNNQDDSEKMFISKPIPVQKPKAPISLSNKGTLDINTMDEKMKSVFQKAGITEQELNNEDFAPFIFDALVVFNENISEFINEKEKSEKENKQLQEISQQISQVLVDNNEKQEEEKKEEKINQQNIQEQNQNQNQEQQKGSENLTELNKKQNNLYSIQVTHPSQIVRDNQMKQQGKDPIQQSSVGIKMAESKIEEIPQENQNQNIKQDQNQNLAPQPPLLQSILPQSNQINAGPPPLNSIIKFNQNQNQVQNQNQEQPPKLNIQPSQDQQVCVYDQVIKNKAVDVESRSNLLDQIRSGNFQLKKASDRKIKSEIKVNVDQNQEKNLTNYLAQAIAQRRNQLKKNYASSSEQYTSSDQYSD